MPDPFIDSYPLFVAYEPLPLEATQAVELLTRPGMGETSALFHAERYDPLMWPVEASAPSEAAARSIAADFAALRRRVVNVYDGLTLLNEVLVVKVQCQIFDAGVVVGATTGDRWIIQAAFVLLPTKVT